MKIVRAASVQRNDVIEFDEVGLALERDKKAPAKVGRIGRAGRLEPLAELDVSLVGWPNSSNSMSEPAIGMARRDLPPLRIGEIVHEVADLVGGEIVLHVDDLLDAGERHHARALRAGFQRGVERDVVQRCGARLVLTRCPVFQLSKISVRLNSRRTRRDSACSACSEEIIVVEIEVDNLAVPSTAMQAMLWPR